MMRAIAPGPACSACLVGSDALGARPEGELEPVIERYGDGEIAVAVLADVLEIRRHGLRVHRRVVRDDVQAAALIPLSLGRGGLKRQWVIAYVKGLPLPTYSRTFLQLCHKWFPRLMTGAGDMATAAS